MMKVCSCRCSLLLSISASGCRMNVTVTKISPGAEVTCTISKGNLDELDRVLRPNVVILIAPETTGYASRGPPAGPHALGTVLHTSLSATKQTVTVKLVSKDTSFLVPRGGASLKHDISGHNVLGTYWLLPSTKLSTFLQEFGALWSTRKLGHGTLFLFVDYFDICSEICS